MRDASRRGASPLPRWTATPWKERVAILGARPIQISEHRSVSPRSWQWKVGKNRLEALGDVRVGRSHPVLLPQMQAHDGFEQPMGRLAERRATSVMRPYGVWAVISPFNFDGTGAEPM